MKKVIVLQARLNSNKLSEKVLLLLAGKPVIWHIIERLRRCRAIDEICAAITENESDDKLAGLCDSFGIRVIRGSDDVLSRYVQAAYATGADVVVRATADDPLVHPDSVDRQVEYIATHPDCDYVYQSELPPGAMVETLTRKTLDKLDYLAKDGVHRKHVTYYLHEKKGSHGFNMVDLPVEPELRHPELRFTLETNEDYSVITNVYDALYKEGQIVSVGSAIQYLLANPQIRSINSRVFQTPSIRIQERVASL